MKDESAPPSPGRGRGQGEPSVTAPEGRWIWNVANKGTTAGNGYPVRRPWEWDALVDQLGLEVTEGGDRIEVSRPR